MERILRDKRAIFLFIFPAIIIYTFIVFIPIIWSGVYTFFDGVPGINFNYTGITNFVKLFSDKLFLKSLLTNLQYVAVVVSGQIILGLLVSFLLLFSIKKYNILARTIIFFPVVLPTVAVAQLFVKIYEIAPQYGLINSILQALRLDYLIQPWLGQPETALWAICIADIWRAIGFYAIIFYVALIDVKEEIIEAARLDGASGVALVRHILLPLIKPIIGVALVLSVTGTLKVFESIVAMTGGGPGTSTNTLTIYMYNLAFKYNHYGYGSTVAIFILIECLLFALIINKLFLKDDTA
jgi:raffinose/stachyose/melibiose transport system permease protein